MAVPALSAGNNSPTVRVGARLACRPSRARLAATVGTDYRGGTDGIAVTRIKEGRNEMG